MFRRIFGPGPEHEQAADQAEAALTAASTTAGETATVRRIVARLEEMPADGRVLSPPPRTPRPGRTGRPRYQRGGDRRHGA